MELKLNIYDDNDKVIKTYTKNSYIIKMKLLKRFVSVLDLEKLASLLTSEDNAENNNKLIAEMGAIINNSYDLFKDLTLSVFPDMKEEEFEDVAIDELAVLVINLVKYTIGAVGIAQTEKN